MILIGSCWAIHCWRIKNMARLCIDSPDKKRRKNKSQSSWSSYTLLACTAGRVFYPVCIIEISYICQNVCSNMAIRVNLHPDKIIVIESHHRFVFELWILVCGSVSQIICCFSISNHRNSIGIPWMSQFFQLDVQKKLYNLWWYYFCR